MVDGISRQSASLSQQEGTAPQKTISSKKTSSLQGRVNRLDVEKNKVAKKIHLLMRKNNALCRRDKDQTFIGKIKIFFNKLSISLLKNRAASLEVRISKVFAKYGIQPQKTDYTITSGTVYYKDLL